MKKTTSISVYCAALAAALLVGSQAHSQANDATKAMTTDVSKTDGPITTKNKTGATTKAMMASASQTSDQQVITTTTAQKRFENIQNVPLAVQVITPAQLEEQGVNNFQELGKVAPSLVIKPADQPLNADVTIRGIGTYAFGIGVESSVAVTVDGAAVEFIPRVFSALPDIAQIEVLAGPQSTLYGKASSAGLIKIMTVQPTDDLHMKSNFEATSDSEYTGNFSTTGPISDTLGYVVSAGYSTWDGNVKNLFDGKEVNGRDAFNSRGKLRWKATPDITFTLSGNYLNGDTTVGRPYDVLAPTALLRGTPGLTNAVTQPGVTEGPENQDISNNYDGRTAYWAAGTLLRSEANIGKLNFLSLTAYDRYRLKDSSDFDATSAPVAIGHNTQSGLLNSHIFTQELRLLSPGEDAFRYAFGLYYANVDYDRTQIRGPAYSLTNYGATAGSRQVAGFGQLDWEFLPHLTATVGGRVQNERINYTFVDNIANTHFAGSAEDSVGTYRLGLSYQATPDIMFFGGYTTGYKGQTYDLTSGFNAARAAAGPIKPETSVDRELGVRTQFFNRRMTFNVTYFNTDYTDLQAQTIQRLAGGAAAFALTNVGQVNTQGVEFESAARITRDLSFNGGLAYLDAKYSSYPVAQCYTLQTAALGCAGTPASQNLTGTTAIQSPKWKGQTGMEYAPNLSAALQGVATVAVQYQSSVYYSARDPLTFQPAFTIVNLALGVRSRDKRWEVKAFVNNLFDKQYFTSLTNVASTFGNQIAAQAVLPRDFRRYAGVRVSSSF
jgi:iron complex outermembrane receptor protein